MILNRITIFLISFLLLVSCGTQFTPSGHSSEDSSSDDIILSWDFSSSSNYTFSSNEINFTGTQAEVKTVPLNTDTSTEFNTGAFSQLEYSAGVLKIASSASTQLSAEWTPYWSYLTGYWRADTDWNDVSVYSNDGVASGGTILDTTIKKVGLASGYFDGVDDIVTVADNDGLDLDIQNSMTISFWMNFDPSTDGTLTRVISKACYDGSAFTQSSYTVIKSGVNELEFYLSSDGSSFTGSAVAGSVRLGAWHHFVGTYDGTDLKVYLDGQLKDTGAFIGPIYNGSADLLFGAREHGAGCSSETQFTNGHLDELAIWSKVFNDEQVSYLYHRQKQKYAGSYESQVIDTGADLGSIWNQLAWVPLLPYYKELPGDITLDGNPDHETSAEYSKLVGSTGSLNDNDLLSQSLLYYRFNGSADYDETIDEVIDYAGLGNDGEADGGNIIASSGKFFEGRYFDGSGTIISATSLSLPPSFAGPRSVSFWVQLDPIQADTDNEFNIIYSEGDGTRIDQVGYYNQTYSVPADRGKVFYRRLDGTNTATNMSSVKVNDGEFHHIVSKYDGGDINIYIDGELAVDSSVSDNTAGSYAGAYSVEINNATDSFSGDIDEFVIWKRSLHSQEIKQLYLRGANRVKFLVKSCVDSSCNCESFSGPLANFNDCDGDGLTNNNDPTDTRIANWKGANNTGLVEFSELLNNTSIDASAAAVGDVKLESPNLDFADFVTAGLSVSNNRYFQYLVSLESDDESTSCLASFCSPEIESISLGSDKKFAGEVSISNLTTFNYNVAFKDFNAVENGSGNCNFNYQLSNDGGSTFYHYLAGNWLAITGANEKNSLVEVKSGIARFSEQFPTGTFKFKAFLQSTDTLSSCSLDQVSIVF